MTTLPADCYTTGQLPGKSIVIGWFPGNVAFYTLSGMSNSLGWDTAVGYLNFDPFGAGTNLPNRTSLVELLTVFDTEQPKRERVQKAHDYYQGLLRAYDPK